MEFNNFRNEDEMTQIRTLPIRHFGKTHPFGRRRNGEPRFMLGPHYPLFFITLITTIVILYYLLSEICMMVSDLWMVAIYVSSACFLVSFIKIGLSIPGIVSTNQITEGNIEDRTRYCKTCNIIRPLKTVHCRDCDICIRGYDHHCVWIGKCVGAQNRSNYYMLLILAVGNIIFFVIATILSQK